MSGGLSPTEYRRFEQKIAHLANANTPSWPGSTLARSSPLKNSSPTNKLPQLNSANLSQEAAPSAGGDVALFAQRTPQKNGAALADCNVVSQSIESSAAQSPAPDRMSSITRQHEPSKQAPLPRAARAKPEWDVAQSASEAHQTPASPSALGRTESGRAVDAGNGDQVLQAEPGTSPVRVEGLARQPDGRKRIEPRRAVAVEQANAQTDPSDSSPPQATPPKPSPLQHQKVAATRGTHLTHYPHSALSPVLGPEHARLPLYRPAQRGTGSTPSPVSGKVHVRPAAQNEGFAASMTLRDSSGRVRLELVPFSQSVECGVVSPGPPPRRAAVEAAPAGRSVPLGSPTAQPAGAGQVVLQSPTHKSSPLPVPALSLFATPEAGSPSAHRGREGGGREQGELAAPLLQGEHAAPKGGAGAERSRGVERLVASVDRPVPTPASALALLHHPTAALAEVDGPGTALDIQRGAEMQAVLAQAGTAESHVYD